MVQCRQLGTKVGTMTELVEALGSLIQSPITMLYALIQALVNWRAQHIVLSPTN